MSKERPGYVETRLRDGGRARAGRGRRAVGAHRSQGGVVGLGPRQAGARVALLHGADHGPAAARTTSPACTTSPSGCCRRRCSPAPTPSEPDARKALLRAGGAVARAWGRCGTWRSTTASTSRVCRPLVAELVEDGGAAAGAGGGVEGAGLPAPRGMLAAPGAGAGAPVAVRLRDLGAGRGSSGCSASTTASRSTPRRPSGGSATTSCPSCSATSWSGGSISRPSGRCRRSWCGARTPSRACRTARWRRRWPASWRSWRSGSGLEQVVVEGRGELAPP